MAVVVTPGEIAPEPESDWCRSIGFTRKVLGHDDAMAQLFARQCSEGICEVLQEIRAGRWVPARGYGIQVRIVPLLERPPVWDHWDWDDYYSEGNA